LFLSALLLSLVTCAAQSFHQAPLFRNDALQARKLEGYEDFGFFPTGALLPLFIQTLDISNCALVTLRATQQINFGFHLVKKARFKVYLTKPSVHRCKSLCFNLLLRLM
jgi:hypothetical protein